MEPHGRYVALGHLRHQNLMQQLAKKLHRFHRNLHQFRYRVFQPH